jgi:hypothetical protein
VVAQEAVVAVLRPERVMPPVRGLEVIG